MSGRLDFLPLHLIRQQWSRRTRGLLALGLLGVMMVRADAEARPWATPEGFFEQEEIRRQTIAPGIDWIAASGVWQGRSLETQILAINLRDAPLRLAALTGERVFSERAYFPRSRVSEMQAASGALAVVNATYFEISATQSPTGLVIQDRRLLRQPQPSRPTLLFSDTRAALTEQAEWQARVTVAGRSRPLSHVNSPSLAGDEVGLYVAPWQKTFGAAGQKEGKVFEVIVKEIAWTPAAAPGERSRLKGRVEAIREEKPSHPLKPGEFALAALEQGKTFFRHAKVGDEVEIEWELSATPGEETAWTEWSGALSAGPILFREGVWTPQGGEGQQVRHPRTVIGLNEGGDQLLLVLVDGRSKRSAGMSFNDLRAYLHHLGAYEAINFDGGGSSAMSAVVEGKARLLNRFSDKSERYVPTALGVLPR